jgi:hypothetical protein
VLDPVAAGQARGVAKATASLKATGVRHGRRHQPRAADPLMVAEANGQADVLRRARPVRTLNASIRRRREA